MAAYGCWKSPITADLISTGAVGLGQIALDGGDVYWSETRPAEGGRSVIVRRRASGDTADIIAPPFNARTRVHEYGGGAFAVAAGTVYFSHDDDQHLYRLEAGGSPRPITPAGPFRYADGAVDRRRGHLICVREDHTGRGQPINALVHVNLQGDQAPAVLVSGNDFYASPRLSPDGSRLAWLTWNHPNMPWDGTELWIGDLDAAGCVIAARRGAGGAAESIIQPEWSPDGQLTFVSDRSGWWNLYRWRGERVEPLCKMAAEFGRPQWAFGQSTYAFASAEEIICSYATQGSWQLARLNTRTGQLAPLPAPFSETFSVRAGDGRAVFCGGSPTEPLSVALLDLATGNCQVARRSSALRLGGGCLSVPEAISFPSGGGRTAHAFFYAPRNDAYAAPAGERPPLLVVCHGGPTGAASTALNLTIQYWTSRGIAVVDVNYGGSTGYGRPYRERLNGGWGVVDVEDCVHAARYLVARGSVDSARLAIRGSSAGGYTTLCALTFHDTFKAGASYYGIGDLEALVRDTHKFESHYEERLVGPYPQRRDLYRARSPIHFTERLSCPIIFFQGLDDQVVPPSQAEAMVAALRAKRLPVAYLAFPGEQHGFRRAGTIRRALEAELFFYARVFGFSPADPLDPIAIENL